MAVTGRCLCKATTFSFAGGPAWCGHCHCESCRRNCSAPVVTFIGAPRSSFRWTGQKTGIHVSSPGVRRHFCTSCGTPMAYDSDEDQVNIHLYAASLDDHSQVVPQKHFFWSERVSWLKLADHLPHHPEGDLAS